MSGDEPTTYYAMMVGEHWQSTLIGSYEGYKLGGR
jgi:hypothetical protein